MVFDFARKNPHGSWEYAGTGHGNGRDAVLHAIEEVASESAGELPAGEYLYRSKADDGSELRGLMTLWSDGSKIINPPRRYESSVTLFQVPRARAAGQQRAAAGA
ncbi:MAG: hypothetical protein U0R52_09990 [Solirubrobacterales bacterium]